MPEFLSLSFLIAAAIAAVAGTVRGFAGFGAAMLMTPVLAALYGPRIGIALCLSLEIIVALPLLPGAAKFVDWRRIGLMLLAAVFGAPLGTLLLTSVPTEPMRWVISAIVLGAVALLTSGWRFSGQPRIGTTLTVGALSGFLDGLAGLAGPPIAFYYLAGNEPAERMRANLLTYFVFVDIVTIAVFAGRGLVGWETGLLALTLAPAVVAGGMLGERLFPLASEQFYRRLALVLLVVVAIASLIL